MAAHSPLGALLFFLLAAVIAVPLFRRFRLGAILGYLTAGVLIGPGVLDLVHDPKAILHFSEIGVVLLLFVIGLELNPEKLWAMKQHIAGLGLGQLTISTLLIGAAVLLLPSSFDTALVVGLALALSSTAFAIQLMAEKGMIASPAGRRGFAILLMQDLAVIPILFLVQSYAPAQSDAPPGWYGPVAIIVLLLIGRFVLDPVLKMVARYGSHETMTAASLLIVVGAAFAMEVSGLSMGMGAFIAGIMLANSSFRHQLESDIEPFKGLTLGLFFMAIGMTLDLGLLMAKPFILFVAAIGLMAVKTAVITLLLRLAKIDWTKGLQAGLMLSQGGEFAFVVMAQATSNGVVSEELAGQVNLVVGLSMALTSPLVALLARLCARRPQESGEVQSEPLFDHDPEVLIMGFGRFGQSTGRILAAKGIPFTALDKNPEQIAFVKRFGNQVHYGDPTQLKVMRAAGIDKVKVVFIAIDNQEQAEKIVSLIRHEYPKVHIVARAHNRAHYWALRAAGAHSVVREMFKGSLQAASKTLTALGYSLGEALRTIDEFELHDEAMLEQTFQHRDDLEKLIEIGRQGRTDLERLFKEDRHY